MACLTVLAGILVAGLMPFHCPRNKVTWLGNEDGIRFGGRGTIWSLGTFQIAGPPHEASRSLEVYLQPAFSSDAKTILAFSTPEDPLRFSLHQHLSDLIVKDEPERRHQAVPIGVNGIFRHIKPVFISITSSARETRIYVDGALSGAFPQFQLARDLAGQLVVGTSPVADNSWKGCVRGLAIYQQELTARQVFQHYKTWTEQGRPEFSDNERAIALYLFDEHGGNVVHNAVRPGIDLYIPERYSLLHQIFLEPAWREDKFGWDHWKDTVTNIAGFIPLGFVFFAYWSLVKPVRQAAWATVVLGLGVSLTIEVLQSFLPTRNSGTIDLVTNTFGTFLGVKLCGAKAFRNLLENLLWFTKTPPV